MPTLPAISFSASAVSSACARLSSAQGPAMSASGKALPNRALPIVTAGLCAGFMAAVMAGPWGGKALRVNRLARVRESPRHIAGARGAVVAKRHQHEEDIFQRAGTCRAEGEQRRGLRVKHHAHLQRADAVLKTERLGAAERRKIKPLERRERRAVQH